MSDDAPRPRFEYGPYVQVACFCETVIEGRDGTFSAIRIIDTITHTQSGPEPPTEMPPVSLPMRLLLLLKSGQVLGRRNIEVRPTKPSGEALPAMTFPAHFEGEEKGIAIQAQMQMVYDQEGVYLFDVCIDGQRLTAIPVRVRYNPLRTALAS